MNVERIRIGKHARIAIAGGGSAHHLCAFRNQAAKALDFVAREARREQHRRRMPQGLQIRKLQQPAICTNIGELRHEDPKQAREIQQAVSESFVELTGKGLAVIGFERSETHGTYLLGQWDSK